MFIAGDAAHIHSPFGGQGMNTGLQDVWNLAWKLDLAVRGRGNELLLESYTAERLPIIRSVIETTHRLTRVMGTSSKLAQTLRNTVIPAVSRLAAFEYGFIQNLSELGIAYDGSPIIEGDGQRYFDQSLRGGKGIGSRFLLTLGEDCGDAIIEAAKRLCESLSDLVELRLVRHNGFILVRPDGYVAYESRKGDASAVLKSVRSLLELQAK
jgi:hypothetical protein